MNNRTIKFKGRKVGGTEWVEGSLLLINGEAYIYPHSFGDVGDIDFGFAFIEVDPETVCQFTGLLDKHGKEIWEGDKLHRHLGIEWVVTFHDSKWVALSANGSGLYLNASEFIEAEVTGSIHDEKPHGNGE